MIGGESERNILVKMRRTMVAILLIVISGRLFLPTQGACADGGGIIKRIVMFSYFLCYSYKITNNELAITKSDTDSCANDLFQPMACCSTSYSRIPGTDCGGL